MGREDRKIISVGKPPMGNELKWAQQIGNNPMPVRYRLSNLCSLFGEEEGEAETCKKEGFKRYAGPKALQEWCFKAMSPASYCVKRVAHANPDVSCQAPFSQFKLPSKCTVNKHCGAGYECIKKICKPSYKRVTQVRAVLLSAGDKNSAEPCSTKVLGTDSPGFEPVRISAGVKGVTEGSPADLYQGYGYATGNWAKEVGVAYNEAGIVLEREAAAAEAQEAAPEEAEGAEEQGLEAIESELEEDVDAVAALEAGGSASQAFVALGVLERERRASSPATPRGAGFPAAGPPHGSQVRDG